MAIDATHAFEYTAPATKADVASIRRAIVTAWRLLLYRRVREAERITAQVTADLSMCLPSSPESYMYALGLLKATLSALRDDPEGALAALDAHGRGSTVAQDGVHSAICLFAYWGLSRRKAFYRHRRPTRDDGSARVRVAAEAYRLSAEAMMALSELRLPLARRLATDALALVDTGDRKRFHMGALPACLLAEALYEEGSLREAENLIRTRVLHPDADFSVEVALRSCALQVAVAKNGAHFGLAIGLLRDAIARGQRRNWPRLVAAAQTERITILLGRGKFDEAGMFVSELERMVQAYEGPSETVRSALVTYYDLARCRYSWARAPSKHVTAHFREVYAQTVRKNDLYTGRRLAIELAGMLHVLGEADEADAIFLDCIRSGMASGLHQTFLDGGPEIGELLARANAVVLAGDARELHLLPYIDQIAAHWHRQARIRAAPRARSPIVLTEREVAVLSLIGRGCSNKSIAQMLKISPETVKSHVRNIFSKLGATARSEAVARAIALSHI